MNVLSRARSSRPVVPFARTLLLTVVAATAAVSLAGCYNSQWGEREREQRRNAARLAPSALQSTQAEASAPSAVAQSEGDAPAPSSSAPVTPHTFRVRIYVTPRYASQMADAKTQIRDMITDANSVLATTAGVSLEIDSLTVWENATSEDDLEAALKALHAKDPGSDVDWVVALVGGMPKATPSFHEIGMADVGGKHIAMRASSRLGEHDAIDKAFDELGGDERASLRRALRRHRACAVFLHEMGHTLGAPHANDPQSIMNTAYDSHMTTYGPDAALRMRASVAARLAPPPAPVAAPVERAAATTEEPGARPPTKEIEGVRAGDQDAYAKTVRALATNDVSSAMQTGAPLFKAYPDVLAVQDLRCQVAMRMGGDFSYTRAECARLMELSTAPAKKREKSEKKK